MKKLLALCLSVVMLGTTFVGCGSNSNSNSGGKQTLKVWSFTNEVKAFATAFEKANPNVKVEYTMVAMTNGDYQAKLQQALAAGGDVPDVFCMDASFVRQYVESDFVADLSSMKSKATAVKQYQFMIDAGTNAKGQTMAYSYQATPGAMFYRRSLAKKYLGTDDPAKVQDMVSTMDKFLQTAETIKTKSNGNTYMIASTGDLNNLYFSNRAKPWVVDKTLTVDPLVDKFWEVAKTVRQKGYEAQAAQWQEGWYAGMNDSLKDASGAAKQIFCYMLPTWGLSYVVMPNAKKDANDTSGDWAIINGPMPYQWGGTWLSVPKASKNQDLAKQFIEFTTMNEQTLTDWAKGTYTNDYLKAINSEVGDLKQPAGDFVNSENVVKKITADFAKADTSKFLGGENSYEAFAKVAPTVTLKILQGTDDAIQRAMGDPLESYVSGKATKDDAMKTWKENVKTAVPDITVK